MFITHKPCSLSCVVITAIAEMWCGENGTRQVYNCDFYQEFNDVTFELEGECNGHIVTTFMLRTFPDPLTAE